MVLWTGAKVIVERHVKLKILYITIFQFEWLILYMKDVVVEVMVALLFIK